MDVQTPAENGPGSQLTRPGGITVQLGLPAQVTRMPGMSDGSLKVEWAFRAGVMRGQGSPASAARPRKPSNIAASTLADLAYGPSLPNRAERQSLAGPLPGRLHSDIVQAVNSQYAEFSPETEPRKL